MILLRLYYDCTLACHLLTFVHGYSTPLCLAFVQVSIPQMELPSTRTTKVYKTYVEHGTNFEFRHALRPRPCVLFLFHPMQGILSLELKELWSEGA